ncbi:MAG: ATP-binding protein [Actinomycetota bacterium]|nr:ATP-binding protein [Actinomycetota bacterium]
MSERDTGNRPLVTLPEAASYLNVPVAAVQSLIDANFLEAVEESDEGPLLRLVDVKAFLARNADNGAGNLVVIDPEAGDPEALLAALDGRSEEMARRAFDIFAAVFPEAQTWSLRQQARFIEQARGRFEAILAVTAQGAEVDEALVDDLQDVGAAAAWDGSPLPQLLVVLRISRDLVVQTAVELAEERGGHWGLALSLLLTRVLPAMDRLTDALAQGYWAAMINRQQEARARYEHLVEHSSDGIYEVDLEGRIQYANPSLAVILGLPSEQLEGGVLSSVLSAVDGLPADALAPEPAGGPRRVEITVVRADGVRRVLDVRTTARIDDGDLVGFQGVVRDVTAVHDVQSEKNEFMALVTNDLRTPLATILGLGATLQSEAEELTPERVRRVGASIRGQAERMSRLADDLSDMSRLEASTLLLNPGPVQLTTVIEGALAHLGHPDGVEVRVPAGLPVVADAQRLEQVLANLLENALQHGEPPVVVAVEAATAAMVDLCVTDHGPGVEPSLVPTLFSRLRTLGRTDRDRSRGTGLGLSLARRLVEATGGRLWYETAAEGGASFHLTLPVPRRRRGDPPVQL